MKERQIPTTIDTQDLKKQKDISTSKTLRRRYEDFTRVLSEVDVLVLLEVYPAGEAPIAGADGRTLARAIRMRGQVEPVFVEQIEELPVTLKGLLRNNDVLLTLGAGNIGAVAAKLKDELENK